MFVQLTSLKFSPNQTGEVKRIFREYIAPMVLQQDGIVTVQLLEPAKPGEDFILLKEWRNKGEADAYQSSGEYKKLMHRIEGMVIGHPVLRTYSVEDTKVPVL
jgi:heme-degrading monooxygenase HmoA